MKELGILSVFYGLIFLIGAFAYVAVGQKFQGLFVSGLQFCSLCLFLPRSMSVKT